MNLIFYLLIPAFIIRTSHNLLYQIFLWQLKEYRLDRIKAHLRTVQGKKLIFNPLSLVKWLLSPFILADIISPYPFFIFGLIWIFEAALNIKELTSYGWRLPKFTLKVILILITSISFILFTLSLLNLFELRVWTVTDRILTAGIFVDRLSSPFIALFIIILNIPTSIFKNFKIQKAKKKISGFHNLITIGITGSYGKTSTKEYLATILSEKFQVAKTPKFTNTDIGIADYVLRDLNPTHQVFVVEMGAYKKGELRTICDMVNPKIGIITGINEQHLELFGSIENTMKAKFELIESLPKAGLAIFNGNNTYCLEMAHWAAKSKLKILTYNLKTDIKKINTYPEYLEFVMFDYNYNFKVNLLGRKSVENILAAIYVARNLKLTWEEIKKGTAHLKSPDKTMKLAGKLNGGRLIDDTFNANPDGIIAAIDYMKVVRGKKILVLTPLIELGQQAEKIHTKLGRELAKICDLILLTNGSFKLPFLKGASESGSAAKIKIVNTNTALKLIQENLDKDGVVVFEGKEASKILVKLLLVN